MRDRLIPPPPRFAHVGVTVPHVEAAMRWYESVLGLELLAGPVELAAGVGHSGRAAADVFGPNFRRLRQAHLATVEGAALELFEFVDPPGERPEDRFDYRRLGCFHFCLVARDVEATVDRVVHAGGRLRSRIWPVAPGGSYRFCFCEDPWGTVFELYSHAHERMYAGREF